MSSFHNCHAILRNTRAYIIDINNEHSFTDGWQFKCCAFSKESSTHYLHDSYINQRFKQRVSFVGIIPYGRSSLETSNLLVPCRQWAQLLLLFDVVFCYLHWPHILKCIYENITWPRPFAFCPQLKLRHLQRTKYQPKQAKPGRYPQLKKTQMFFCLRFVKNTCPWGGLISCN